MQVGDRHQLPLAGAPLRQVDPRRCLPFAPFDGGRLGRLGDGLRKGTCALGLLGGDVDDCHCKWLGRGWGTILNDGGCGRDNCGRHCLGCGKDGFNREKMTETLYADQKMERYWYLMGHFVAIWGKVAGTPLLTHNQPLLLQVD